MASQAATQQTTLDEKLFIHLAQQIRDEWKKLAIFLGISDSEICQIQTDEKYMQDQIFRMLQTWKQRGQYHTDGQGSSAMEALCSALEKSGRSDLVIWIKKYHGATEAVDTGHDIQKEFIKYYRDTMGVVPMIPWFPEESCRIDNIFVELQLVTNVLSAKKLMPHDINCYKDILRLQYSDRNPVRHILISGEAGSGKTTITSRIAYDWTLQRQDSPLSKFQLLVALNLRELDGKVDLTQAIYDQILPKDTQVSPETLEKYLKSHAEEVLVILDGFDEFVEGGSELPTVGDIIDLISNKILRGCTVIVTTRPHLVDKLFKLNSSFTHIKSKGFSKDGVKAYTEKFFGDEDKEKASKLHHRLKESDTLHNLARIPIVLLIICFIWLDECKLPETLTELFQEALKFTLKRHFKKTGQYDPDNEESVQGELKKLVQKLGKAALDDIMLPLPKLVFQPSDFEDPKVVERSVKVGILSQERMRSKLRTVQHVTFLHKTIQEMIAGSYWANLFASDKDLFTCYLAQINMENIESLQYLLRFCCGANEQVGRCLLTHIVEKGRFSLENLTKHDGWNETCDVQQIMFLASSRLHTIRQIQNLCLLMCLEAQSSHLHTIITPIFENVLYFNFGCALDLKTALRFLVENESKSSVSQSFLTQMKHVVLEYISRNDLPLVRDVLHHAKNVTTVDLQFCRETEMIPKNWQLDLADRLFQMPLVNLSLMMHEDYMYTTPQFTSVQVPSNLSYMIDHLVQSDMPLLQTLALSAQRFDEEDLYREAMQKRLHEHKQNKIGDVEPKFPKGGTLQIAHEEQACSADCQHLPNLQELHVDGKGLPVDTIISILSNSPKLKVLHLCTINASASLYQQLQKCKSLQELTLNGRGLVSHQLVQFSKEIFSALVNLRRLSLAYRPLHPNNLFNFLQWSCCSSSLKELDLDYQELIGYSWIAHPAYTDTADTYTERTQTTRQSSIERLKVQCDTSDRYTPPVVRFLKQMPALKILEIVGMKLTLSLAEYLAESLPHCKQLHTFCWVNTKCDLPTELDGSSIEKILKVLPRLPGIQKVKAPTRYIDCFSDMVQRCYESKSNNCWDLKDINTILEIIKRYNFEDQVFRQVVK